MEHIVSSIGKDNRFRIPRERKDVYSLGIYFRYWPKLVWSFRRIHTETDLNSLHEQAFDLQSFVARIDCEVKEIGDPIINRMYEKNRVIELPDDESPIGVKVVFANLDALQTFVNYSLLHIMMNRFSYYIDQLMGSAHDRGFDSEHHDLCRQIWMCIPAVRSLGIVAMVLFNAPLYISYAGAYDDEKDYLLDFVFEAAEYKSRLPGAGRDAVEAFVLNTERAAMGQRPFDVRVENTS